MIMDDAPVLLLFAAAPPCAASDVSVNVAELEKVFEVAVSRALHVDCERVSWFEGSSEEGGALRVHFCLYPAGEGEGEESGAKQAGQVESCAALAGRLMELAASSLFDDDALAALRGSTLSIVREDDEDEEFVDEVEALKLLDASQDALSVVRRLFLPEPERPQQPQLSILHPRHIAKLEQHGYVVVDDVLEADTAVQVGAAAMRLARDTATGGFQRAGLAGHDASVRDDVTCFLSDDSDSPAPALQNEAVQAAADTLRAVHRDISLAVRLRYGASRPELQLAVYDPAAAVADDGAAAATPAADGETRYERHRDGFPSAGLQDEDEGEGPMWRRVTAILYCNSPAWSEVDGGALRLYSPAPTDGGGSVDVLPVAGKLVVFMSGAVEHEVLPVYSPRVALTAWFS